MYWYLIPVKSQENLLIFKVMLKVYDYSASPLIHDYLFHTTNIIEDYEVSKKVYKIIIA